MCNNCSTTKSVGHISKNPVAWIKITEGFLYPINSKTFLPWHMVEVDLKAVYHHLLSYTRFSSSWYRKHKLDWEQCIKKTKTQFVFLG